MFLSAGGVGFVVLFVLGFKAVPEQRHRCGLSVYRNLVTNLGLQRRSA